MQESLQRHQETLSTRQSFTSLSRLEGLRNQRLCRPGAKGFENAERRLWRLDLPPGEGECTPDLSPAAPPGSPAAAPARTSTPERAGAALTDSDGDGPNPDPTLIQAGRAAGKSEGEVVGYWREHSTLSHVVVRNAGHMVPHDRPVVAQARRIGGTSTPAPQSSKGTRGNG